MVIENLGIGIDIVEIDRFKAIPFNKKKNFYKKIFDKSEISYCMQFKDPYRHFAAKFAVKEALKKSIHKKIDFLDIVTFHMQKKPNVKLRHNNDYVFLVSLSHEQSAAVAVVIAEKIN